MLGLDFRKVQHCSVRTLPYPSKLLGAGGDACSALQDDVDGDLSWYIKGHQIALDIARGLFFLHSHGVRCCCLFRQRVQCCS